ncbi:hypothetical protein B0I12_002946 [Microbacterium hydrothermale]|nr:hypothetical protein [Microbacterium hydrothermale]
MPRDKRLFMTFPNDFWQHPKIEPLSDGAFRAFVEMNGYSRMQDLDGRIPVGIARKRWKPRAIQELLNTHPTRPVLLQHGDDYVLRDYAQHQETRAEREARVARNTENGRRGGRPRKNPQETQSVTDSDSEPEPTGNPERTEKKAEIEIEIETEEIPTESLSSETALAALRPEIESLLDLLDAEILGNGSKPPSRTQKNRDAVRLMLDRDGRTVEQIENAIRWCQADPFWRSNILSAAKLREKYDQLRLAAQRDQAPRRPTRLTPEERARQTYAELSGTAPLSIDPPRETNP